MKKIIEGTAEEIREYESKENGHLDKFLNVKPDAGSKKILSYPDKVTFKWLKDHVPIKLWLALAGVIVAVFVGGVQASKLSFVQEIFDIKKYDNHKPAEMLSINKTRFNKSLNTDTQ